MIDGPAFLRANTVCDGCENGARNTSTLARLLQLRAGRVEWVQHMVIIQEEHSI
jgi:hypothetical protein